MCRSARLPPSVHSSVFAYSTVRGQGRRSGQRTRHRRRAKVRRCTATVHLGRRRFAARPRRLYVEAHIAAHLHREDTRCAEGENGGRHRTKK